MVFVAVILAIAAGFIGSNLISIPNLFFTELVQYPVILWVLLVDVFALVIFKMGRSYARIQISQYSQKKEFKVDLQKGNLSKHRYSRAIYVSGPLMYLCFLFLHSLAFIAFSFYYWCPLFQTGFTNYIGVYALTVYFEAPLIVIPNILAPFVLLDDSYELQATLLQSMINMKMLEVRLRLNVQSRKGVAVEEVVGDLVYLGDELILEVDRGNSRESYTVGWENIETYSLILPKNVVSV
ncbi:MAG: hypothetical protein QXU18_13725 [Thermoplasmatales archaeon]